MDLNLSFSAKTTTFDYDKLYDVLVIGAGPAGESAALYAKRKGLAVAIVGKKAGGQVMDTSSVENYLGIPGVSGEELSQRFYRHIQSYNIPVLKENRVKTFIKNGNGFTVSLENAEVIRAKTLIIATGSKPRKLNIKGEDTFAGKGVCYCAICDGPLFEGLNVVVAGGGNSAVEAAMDLSKIARSVTLVHRSQLRADEILVEEMKKIRNIHLHLQTDIQEVLGETIMNGVKVFNKETRSESIIKAEGLFVEIGYTPNTEFVEGILELNSHGEIVINSINETSLQGVFAAGDVTTVPYKQIVVGVGEGAKAALSANQYLR